MNKKPFVTKEQLEAIIQKHPTPFYLYDEKGIRANAAQVKRAFAWNKGYREYFAVKATPNPYLLEIMKDEGFGTDCSSLTELMLSNAVGFRGKSGDIMFSSNETPDADFLLARKLDAIINLDDFTHIDILNRLCGIPETICCRYNPGGVFKASNEIMDNPGDSKYGFTKEQMFEGFRRLQQLGAKRFGIHAFLASNTTGDEYYPVLAKQLFQLAVELHRQTGAHISFINLSGGVGVAYRPEDTPANIEHIGRLVQQAYDEILTPEGMGDVALFTEMGRFMMGPYGCLVATAIREKHIYKEYIGLDACAADLMRPAMYGAYHHITVSGKENRPCDHKYDIVGGLCENNDKFAIDRMLPKISMGDRIILHDAGAHGHSMGYNYNGKLRCAELLLMQDGSAKQIRRAETPADYFATLDYPGLPKNSRN